MDGTAGVVEGLARTLRDAGGGTVDRPLRGGGTFPLSYVRTGPRTGTPVVVVPGGPGLASVLPYWSLRSAATRRGLDVVMVEHRGVGLSRRDHHGHDLTPADVTVEDAADDLAAVLDAVGADRAVVYGSSYGTYVAQTLGVRHPQRVAAMVLDSPLLSVTGDLAAGRAHRRRLLWDGTDPTARAVRAADAPADELAAVVQTVHEFAGPDVLRRLLTARDHGRLGRTWRWAARFGDLGDRVVRFVDEPDLVAGIAYGQLGFGLPPDGGPLDPQLAPAGAAAHRPPYRGEPYDLPALLPAFTWPTVVVSGERDLRTPSPVAERLTGLLPHGVLLRLDRLGHSALDSHQLAALLVAAAAVAGTVDRLPALAPRISALPRRGASRFVGTAISAAVRVGG
ncbi:alpha/beta fold hydrolase [Kineococcus sp. SYSU DK001]|uniref:alpha/beta fold hydrolase n=1 Tax=Kineococcus sp. SYSU DK001 TaxID=3383122 RepID=UPI003D7F08A5